LFGNSPPYDNDKAIKANMERDEMELNEKNSLGAELSKFYNGIIRDVQRNRNQYPITNVVENKRSRDNLLCYLTLRKHNLENLQMRLAEQGLSSLGRLEGHVLNGIELVLKHFPIHSKAVRELTASSSGIEKITYKDAQNILDKRSRSLLGRPREGRTTRIMVTLDVEAIHQPQLVEEQLKNVMDIARIDCAHVTKREWKRIIDAIHNAEERLTQQGQALNRKCRIVMDLAGPKIRTGPMPLEVRPLQIAVPKDVHKKRIKMVEGYLDSEASFTEKISLTGIDPSFVISISKGKEILPTLNVGESLSFIDARGRPRTMVVLERTSHTRIRIGIEKTIYLQECLRLNRQKEINAR
jgi:pyruvate kinase